MVSGATTFNGTSTAANAFIENWGGGSSPHRGDGLTIFNDTSTAGHATITNYGQPDPEARPSSTVHRLPTAQFLSLKEGYGAWRCDCF